MGSVGEPISHLLTKYRGSIDLLRENLAAGGPVPPSYDDIFLLRYILSAKTVEKAIDRIREAERIRKAKAHVFEAADRGEELPWANMCKSFQCAAVWTHPAASGGPLWIVRTGYSEPIAMMENITHDQCVDWNLWYRIIVYNWCDEATRRTGKLVKHNSIIDFNSASLKKSRCRAFFKALGEASKLSEALFPQLQEKNVMINVPWFFKILNRFVRLFLPRHTMEKMRICPVKNTASGKEDIRKCPFVQANFPDLDKLPEFLGGTCPVPRGNELNTEGKRAQNTETPDQVSAKDMKVGLTAEEQAKYDEEVEWCDCEEGPASDDEKFVELVESI